MRGYTDRLIVKDIEQITVEAGTFEMQEGRNFKKARVISAGKSPNGDSNKELEGKEILFFDTVIPERIPVGENMFLMKRTNIEIIL